MFDLKATREEFAQIHAETEKLVIESKDRDLTEDETKAQADRFAKMDKLQKLIDDNQKLAKYAFANNSPEVTLPAKSADQVSFENIEFATDDKFDKVKFAKAATDWCKTGQMRQEFANITTASQSGILLPSSVSTPILPNAVNTFRAAFNVVGLPVSSFPTAAVRKLPVMDAAAGGVVSETASSETENAPSLSKSITLTFSTYQSGSVYFSNQELAAVDYDLLGEVLPQMYYSKELGLESAIATAITGDAGITQSVAASTVSAFTYKNLVSLNRSLPKKYDFNKVIILSKTAFAFAEGLTDTTNKPVLCPDPQNQQLLRFNGTPVLRSDYFADFGSSTILGVVISLAGFKLADVTQSNLARYVNVPARPNATGLNLFSYHAYGYASDAMATLKCPVS